MQLTAYDMRYATYDIQLTAYDMRCAIYGMLLTIIYLRLTAYRSFWTTYDMLFVYDIWRAVDNNNLLTICDYNVYTVRFTTYDMQRTTYNIRRAEYGIRCTAYDIRLGITHIYTVENCCKYCSIRAIYTQSTQRFNGNLHSESTRQIYTQSTQQI